MNIDEAQLENYAVCPLRFRAVGELELACRDTTNWALIQTFIGIPVGIHEMQVHFEKYLKDTFKWNAWKLRHSAASTCRVLAKRLDTLLSGHKVLQPNTPYHLLVSGETITGQYAVIEQVPTRRKSILRTWGPEKLDRTIPDIVSIARWLHYFSQEGVNIGVYHFEFPEDSRDGSYATKISLRVPGMNEILARQYMNGIILSMKQGLVYPSPGAHCGTCESETCREVVNYERR